MYHLDVSKNDYTVMHEVFEKLFDMPIYVNSSCDQNEVKWCALRDSNPQPFDSKSNALSS